MILTRQTLLSGLLSALSVGLLCRTAVSDCFACRRCPLSDCRTCRTVRLLSDYVSDGIHCRRVGLSDRGRGSACAVPLASTLKPHVNGNNCQCHKTLYSTHTAPQQLYRLQLYSCRPGTGAAAGSAVPGVLRLPPLELQRPVW